MKNTKKIHDKEKQVDIHKFLLGNFKGIYQELS